MDWEILGMYTFCPHSKLQEHFNDSIVFRVECKFLIPAKFLSKQDDLSNSRIRDVTKFDPSKWYKPRFLWNIMIGHNEVLLRWSRFDSGVIWWNHLWNKLISKCCDWFRSDVMKPYIIHTTKMRSFGFGSDFMWTIFHPLLDNSNDDWLFRFWSDSMEPYFIFGWILPKMCFLAFEHSELLRRWGMFWFRSDVREPYFIHCCI